jgi:replicative DNA helicase
VSTDPQFSETRRALFDLLRDINAELASAMPDAELLATLAGRVRALQDDATAGDPATIEPAPSQLADVLAEITRRHAHFTETGEPYMGHRTGFPRLDDLLGGLDRNRVTVLLASPAAGKTTLSNQLAWTVASAGAPVLYVTYENQPSDLIQKTLARLAGVNPSFIDRGRIAPADLAEAAQTFTARGQTLHYLRGTSTTTVETIRAAVVAMMDRNPGAGHPLILLDYLQMMSRHAGPYENTTAQISATLATLSRLIDDYDGHIWAISSMNRESRKNGKGGERADSGTGSGAIEYDAAAVLTLTTPDNDTRETSNSEPLLLRVVKNRFGQCGALELNRDRTTLRIAQREATLNGVHPNGSAGDRVRAGWER